MGAMTGASGVTVIVQLSVSVPPGPDAWMVMLTGLAAKSAVHVTSPMPELIAILPGGVAGEIKDHVIGMVPCDKAGVTL